MYVLQTHFKPLSNFVEAPITCESSAGLAVPIQKRLPERGLNRPSLRAAFFPPNPLQGDEFPERTFDD